MKVVVLALSIAIPGASTAAEADSLSVKKARTFGDTLELPAVVTTAAKIPKPLRDSPVPTSVIGEKEMRSRCAARLSDVLAEETGLSVLHSFRGAGVQMQGLDADYTLILVDGEPAIGRTAGTLNLDRMAVGGIRQVEVVKGPSSSLYGSEALAGVINLVTREPQDTLAFGLRSRYGSFGILDANGEAEFRRGGFGGLVFLNANTSDGYDLSPETIAKTAPRYRSFTLQPKGVYEMGKTRFTFSPRLVWEKQDNLSLVTVGAAQVPSRDHSELEDWNASAGMESVLSPSRTLSVKGHAGWYRTYSSLIPETGGATLSSSAFDQRFYKAETFLKQDIGKTHTVLLGGGGILESVEADRIAGGRRFARSGFTFFQEEWRPSRAFLFQGGGRLDVHEDYAAHVSPRLAGLFKPLPWLGFRASVGNGFKAPTFQQLYLDFTNPQVGYTVIGSTGAKEGMERLRQQGQIQSDLQDLSGYTALRPENSWSFNLGLEAEAGRKVSLRTNLFRNNVEDLIETAPVALKMNGQSVFTYFNLNRIHTQGMESEAAYMPWRWLTLSLGYQYLETADEKIVEDIEAGRISKVGATGRIRPVQLAEYGGLFNRSRHSATFKLAYEAGKSGFSGNVRSQYRGRYGIGDRNANQILDDDREYAPGYWLWNATLSQKISRFFSVQAGLENLLDKTDQALPSLPGRKLYGGLSLQYF